MLWHDSAKIGSIRNFCCVCYGLDKLVRVQKYLDCKILSGCFMSFYWFFSVISVIVLDK